MKALMSSVTSGLRLAGHFANPSCGTQADVALRSFRVPRPSASSFTYRNGAPRRPESASKVGALRGSDIPCQRCSQLWTLEWTVRRNESVRAAGHAGSECIWYSAIVRQPCSLPGAVGWMFPVGKGGARLSGRGTRTETSTPLTSAYTNSCAPMHPETSANKSRCTQKTANKLSNSLKEAT